MPQLGASLTFCNGNEHEYEITKNNLLTTIFICYLLQIFVNSLHVVCGYSDHKSPFNKAFRQPQHLFYTKMALARIDYA